MDDTAVQLNRARGNERLTATLTDTMHEDTKVMKQTQLKTIFQREQEIFSSIYCVCLEFLMSSVHPKLKLNVLF